MLDPRAKRAVLAVLSYEPDFSGLVTLPALESPAGRELLQWLDRSGLALTFSRRLQKLEAASNIPIEWQQALGQRLRQNAVRMQDVLEEVQRINTAFHAQGVTAAVLKGISLVPDFCEELALRHQVDLDFLVHPASVELAAEVLQSCGYSAARLNHAGETCFRTPLRTIPSADDNLYTLQRQRQVDLHTSILEACPWIPVEVPVDCLERSLRQHIHGVEYLGLSLEDKFLLHVFHAFRHSFRSWIRVSWLLEIARCMEAHQGDVVFWNRVIERAGESHLSRKIFAFVLGLVHRLFQAPIPPPLQAWTAEAQSLSLQTWLDYFAVDWATCDWPGSLNNLFLTAEFIPDRKLRMPYLRSRMLPGKSHTSIGAVAASGASMFCKLQAARLRYMAQRASAHLGDIVRLPIQLLRWKRALEASRRGILDPHC